MQRCLCAWKCSDRIIVYVCKTSCFLIPFCTMHLTISAPLNGDQLCGHVYVLWPNYSSHCCRQQINVSWDMGYLSGQKSTKRSIVSAQSSCFNFKTISVTDLNSPGITNLCFPWPDYGYCYSIRESKSLNEPNRSFWSIVLVWKIIIDVDYKKIVLNCSLGDSVHTSRWPNYIANYSQGRSVPRCLCEPENVQIGS